MAQTTIQGGFLATDLVSAQTALTTGLATTDEIIVSDGGVIKKMAISVLEIAATQITASGTLPALNGAALTALNGTQITSGTLPAARIADDSIVEAKLDVSNSPSNGQFLQAQSGESGGLTWAAATSDFIGCRLSKSAHQTVSGSSGNFITAVTFDGEDFDTDNMHDNSTNPDRITINTAGVYAFGCFLPLESSTSVRKIEIIVGSNIYQASWYTAGGGDDRVSVSGLYNMTTSGNTSYIHVRYSYYGTDSNQRVYSGATFWAYRVGSV